MKPIHFFNLTGLHKHIRKELNTAVSGVIDKGNFILGDEVRAFEKEFARYVGIRYAVGVASGTDALTLSLLAHGIGPGDEVIIPANSYPSAFGVAKSGCRLVLADVTHDGLIDPVSVRRALTKKTRAIVAVHLYGTPAPIAMLSKLLSSNALHSKLLLVEDCAQAHGATIGKKPVGSIGDIGCFSFYPSKNLGALGDGGMITTNSSKAAAKLKQLRMYGETMRYSSDFVAGVSRLDELQAAILRVKLRHLDEWVAKRREIARYYIKKLTGTGDIQIVTTDIAGGAFHLFIIRTKKRDKLKAFLEARSIQTGIHYPTAIHLQKAFTGLGYVRGDFSESESMSKEILSLPIYPHLTGKEVLMIIKTITQFYRES